MQSGGQKRSIEDQIFELGANPLGGRDGTLSDSDQSRFRPETKPVPIDHESSHCPNVEPQVHRRTSAIESPTPIKSRGTYELKFLIDEGQAAIIKAWAKEHLDADCHADPSFRDGYRVNSLYLDTPHFDVFHGTEEHRQMKYRLRRYGSEGQVWCELKRKSKGLVRKRRISVEESELARRLALRDEANWEGSWFQHQLEASCLRPVCQVTYQRFAYTKETHEGNMRLTIDDHLKAQLCDTWEVPSSVLDGGTLLNGQSILELKFQGAMPVLFRRLIEEQQLHVTSFSKYRTSVEKCVPQNWLLCTAKQGVQDV